MTNPLNTSVFVADPCKSLTAQQQKELGLDGGQRSNAAAPDGESCFYRTPTKNVVAVVIAQHDTDGLSMRYWEHVRGMWNYWAPTVVTGYPAVGYNADVDERARTHCSFAIGIADSLHFWVTADEVTGAPRCSVAREVATAVLATVRANQ